MSAIVQGCPECAAEKHMDCQKCKREVNETSDPSEPVETIVTCCCGKIVSYKSERRKTSHP